MRLDRLPEVAARVTRAANDAYPSGEIPIHGRFRHFGADRLKALDDTLARRDHDASARARAQIDLVVVSVLLDAGAGTDWRYRDPSTGAELARSEGLAVASFHMFMDGAFSHDDTPSATADGLEALSETKLASGFQVDEGNPLIGVSARCALLNALGRALRARSDLFGPSARPGVLIDHVAADAKELLRAVLEGIGPIWPSRLSLSGENLGDVWHHSKASDDGLVPFHKLSQWLTYSLVDPYEQAGGSVTNVEALTGLAEYRNGGLFVDAGVLVPKHSAVLDDTHAPDAEIIVEWRALTIVLLDRLAREMNLPLAQLLEGGTWRAGREIAKEKRPDGSPPISVQSDGTLF